MGRIQHYSALNCAVNPQACREREARLVPALHGKKVLVLGGGVAGCEAARVLALRGHQPVVYEKTGRLGGNLIPGGTPSFKEDDHALAAWYEHELKALGVEVHLNTTADEATVKASGADVVIVATGSKPKVFPLGSAPVYPAADILLGNQKAGEHVAIIGGGLVGCETALWLREMGKTVTIVEAMPKILAVNGPLCSANSEMLEALVPFKGIETVASAKATDYDGKTLTVETAAGSKAIAADTVILAVGYASENALYKKLRDTGLTVHLLGDARQVSNIMYAIWDAYEVASTLE